MSVKYRKVKNNRKGSATRGKIYGKAVVDGVIRTKEIAEKRFSSFHTVNTHRKNIFRKLNVNNVHEATKYALRAGLVDTAEYYI